MVLLSSVHDHATGIINKVHSRFSMPAAAAASLIGTVIVVSSLGLPRSHSSLRPFGLTEFIVYAPPFYPLDLGTTLRAIYPAVSASMIIVCQPCSLYILRAARPEGLPTL